LDKGFLYTKKKVKEIKAEFGREEMSYPFQAVFSSEIFRGNIPIALSLLFGKIYPTIN
jgi:hypothetical protein